MKRTLFASVMVGLAALLQFGCGETKDDAPEPIQGPPNPIQAEKFIFAVLQNGNLVRVSSLDPTVALNTVPITGLQGGESIVSIDFRNANGILYGMSNQGRLFHINTTTGEASRLRISASGDPFFNVPASGTRQSMDFDNQTDRMRVISDADQNLRVNPVNGAQNADTNVSLLNQPAVDLNIVSIAHTFQFDQQNPNQNNAPFTMVAVDSNLDQFLSTALGNPNDGIFQNFSQLAGLLPFVVEPVVPINTGNLTGLDFSQVDQLFGSFTPEGGNTSQLWASTRQGIANFGNLPGGSAAVDIAVQIDRPSTNFVAVDENNQIVRFNSARPTELTAPAVTISNLESATEVVRGCDFRPATGQFVITTIDTGDNAFRAYSVNLADGVATQLCDFNAGVDAVATGVGVDFNPTVDRLRLVDTQGRNLRINLAGSVTTDTNLAYAVGDPFEGTAPRVAAVAYTNSFEGASATQLFGIDTAQDALVIQNPPNAGTLNSTFSLSSDGVTALDFDDSTAFDIDTFNNQGWATIFNDAFDGEPNNGIGAHNLVRLNLANGRCAVLEIIGGGRTVKCFTVLPPGV